MRTLIVLLAALGLVAGGTTAAGAIGSNEYICSMYVTPTAQHVPVGTAAHFSVQKNVCSRSTGQFLYTDPEGTYWGSSNNSVADVGSATNFATMNVTVATHQPGTVTITATALCCDINYQGVSVNATLTVDPLHLSVTMSGPSSVRAAGGLCWWASSATNGVPPYTYAWRRNNVLVGTDYAYSSSSFPASFNLTVDVTDSTGYTSGAFKAVSVSQSGTPCDQF